MAIVHIGIGSNLGDRQANCREAVRLLGLRGIRVLKQSSMRETEPWGRIDQPLFINMAVEAESDHSPEDLLALLKDIEKEMGRESTARWGPRIIDLDILFYEDRVFHTDSLSIPHPLLHERMFVLDSLCEIIPEKLHPVFQKTIRTLREERA